jgi:intracellular multiplication protein IcmB
VYSEPIIYHKQNKDWSPSLLGDPIRPRLVEDNPNPLDQSHVLNMDIGFQLFNKTPSISESDNTAVKYGDLFYKPLNMDMPPSSIRPFSELFSDIDDDIPWRMSVVIESGHNEIVKKITSKKTWATLLAITSGVNKEIKKAAQEFMDLCDDDETLCSTKISFMTWGKSESQLSSRVSTLIESIQGWGAGNVIEEIGDPIELWVNMLPGVSRNFISTGFPMMIREAFYVSPISRPASPWSLGSMLYRTYDKKLFPVEPMSSKQASWTDLYYAPPGSGKSFKLAADNLGLIINSSNTMLPRIAMIDIGFSSGSFVDFVRSCLPDDKKDLAQSFKLEMTKDSDKNNINVFDTPLGLRKPLAIDREFLINFLTAMFTPASADKPPARIDEMCGPLIDEMYEHLSDEKEPNIYQYGMIPEIDDLLTSKLGKIPTHMTWWQVVDLFFDYEEYILAAKAQRYAVPNLTDITTVITASKNIESVFGNAVTESGERLLDFIKMMTVSALGDYPILAQPSSFDTGRARIISLDLSSVTPKGKGSAAKKTGLMYMTGMYITCKDFYRKESETIPQVPDKYKKYHREILQIEAGVKKKVCMDEFHRTSDEEGVRSQVTLNIREGRKYNVSIALLSQSLSDFDKDMVDLADNFYILSKGKTESVIKEIKETFSPREDSIDLLKKYVTGPDGKEGTAMLYLGSLKGGRHSRIEQVIYLTISSLELWAYTTTREDYNLRETLSEKIGLLKAMDILIKEFPSGSAKDTLEKYKDSIESEEDIAKLYELVSNKLINKYHGAV